MSNILEKLRGTDLRSIGRANEIVHDIQKNPTLFKSVFKGLTHNDAVIKMRSADIVEKASLGCAMRSLQKLLEIEAIATS